MPDRILRVGILTSESVNRLSWPAEVFYRRLMSVVDDFGRYDGRPAVLRASLYALKVDRVSEPDIGKWIRETEEAGLVRTYTVTEKPYLEISKFDQKVRAVKSKWPDPPLAIVGNCRQTPANAPVVEVGVVVEDGVNPLAPGDKSPSHAGAVNGDAVAHIPLVGGVEWGVPKALAAELESAYPAVDVPQTLLEIRAWCVANPSKRKTPRGVARFINSWCARIQDRG
jgi:hypothetical protein